MFGKSLTELEQEREQLEHVVRTELTPEQKKEYYAGLADELKDSDTYAALNFFFFLGVHELYLKKYVFFFVTLAALLLLGYSFYAGPYELFYSALGVCVVVESKALFDMFRSEPILYEYNTKIMRAKLNKVQRTPA